MTIYVKILQDAKDFHLVEWKPWINCKPEDVEMLPRLALNKWIRERGGVQPGESFSVAIYHYDSKTPTHPNGKPKQCQSITYKVDYDANR